MDSRENPDQRDEENGGDENGFFDFFYAFSDEEGDTWSEIRLTPQSFNVAPAIAGVFNGIFYGDYMGMGVAGKRVYPFYTVVDGDPLRGEAATRIIVFGTPETAESVTATIGSIIAGDLNSIVSSDDNRLQVRSDPSGIIPTSEIEVVFSTAVQSPKEVDILVEGFSTESTTNGQFLLHNWAADQFDVVHVYDVAQNADAERWARGIPAANYIRASDGRIELRIHHESAGGAISVDSFFDHVQVVVVE